MSPVCAFGSTNNTGRRDWRAGGKLVAILNVEGSLKGKRLGGGCVCVSVFAYLRVCVCVCHYGNSLDNAKETKVETLKIFWKILGKLSRAFANGSYLL